MAGILLRRKLEQLWTKLDQQVQLICKAQLLELLANETQRPIRRCIGFAISSITPWVFDAEGWPELLQLLVEWCKSPDDNAREVNTRAPAHAHT
jgi:hypothetical protein